MFVCLMEEYIMEIAIGLMTPPIVQHANIGILVIVVAVKPLQDP